MQTITQTEFNLHNGYQVKEKIIYICHTEE